METQGLNTTADVVLLTAAIYFTGGPYSPLLATYVIVIAVLSLLSNLGITVMMAAARSWWLYAAMVIGVTVGILPPTPVPGAPGAVPSVGIRGRRRSSTARWSSASRRGSRRRRCACCARRSAPRAAYRRI